jgi:hypothetical protein
VRHFIEYPRIRGLMFFSWLNKVMGLGRKTTEGKCCLICVSRVYTAVALDLEPLVEAVFARFLGREVSAVRYYSLWEEVRLSRLRHWFLLPASVLSFLASDAFGIWVWDGADQGWEWERQSSCFFLMHQHPEQCCAENTKQRKSLCLSCMVILKNDFWGQ